MKEFNIEDSKEYRAQKRMRRFWKRKPETQIIKSKKNRYNRQDFKILLRQQQEEMEEC